MSLTLIVATLRQRFTSPIRILILLMIAWTPMLAVFAMPVMGLAPLQDCYFITIALAAGMIGQDVSSGTLQLLLARPVTRAGYVLSRWAAVASGTFAVVVLQVALAWLIMLLRGVAPSGHDTFVYLADNALLACGTAAVMAALSSLAPGLGDLGLLLLLFISAKLLTGIGEFRHWSLLARAAGALDRSLKPELHVAAFSTGTPWPALVAYLSTVAVALAVAIMVMNRRELSYASG